MNNLAAFNIVQWLAPIMVAIIMPILLFILAAHARRAERNAEAIKEIINSLGSRLEAHILWHLGKRDDK